MGSRPVRQHLWLLVAVLSSMTLIITAVSLFSVRAEDSDITDLTTVVGPAYQLNAGILQTMTNAETGLRGYLADHDPVLLAPYGGAEQQVGAARRQLRALLASPRIGAADQRRYARLQAAQDAAITSWWRYAAGAMAEAARGRTPNLVHGKVIFDRVRAVNASLASVLTAHLQALRELSRRTLGASAIVLLGTTGLAVLAGLVVAGGISRAVTAPIVRLRQVAQCQRTGDMDLRADTGSGPSEVRDLAAAFNMLTAHNAELATAQAEALRLQQVASDIGRAIRATSGVQQAMDAACARLGPALAVRRVGTTVFDKAGKISAVGQWHAPGLEDITSVTAELESHMAQTSIDLWSSAGRLVIDDVRADDRPWARLVHAETGATALILAPIGLGHRAIGNLYVATDGGRRHWTEAEAALVQQVATFLARAITQAEYELQHGEYVSRLENLDRQKTEFLSTVSHELRTPLTSIQGYLELLLEGEVGPLGADQRHMLGVIERNTTRLRGLIEDILVLNKIETGGLLAGHAEVPMRELADQTAEELRPLADKKAVRLLVDAGDDPAAVTGDRSQLQRALVNILSNAIKFTPAEGTVELSCRADPGEVVVTCRDTGIGIPEADLEHLFTRFFRASNAASQAIPGTGLGLAIVQAIVDIHHGRLSLDSAEGKGTTITISFPRADAPDRAQLPCPGTSLSPNAETKLTRNIGLRRKFGCPITAKMLRIGQMLRANRTTPGRFGR
jgi:signal transduction histidine kinase/CHASE3 domain sensor protein